MPRRVVTSEYEELQDLKGVIDPTKLDMLDPDNICGARTSEGTICKNRAGWGTNHYGRGRCKLHDVRAKSPKKLGMINQKEYLVSSLDEWRAARLAEMINDPDLLNCRAELAFLKLKFEEIAKDESTKLSVLAALATTITKNAKIIHEMEFGKRHYIHISIAGALVSAFADIGRRYVTSPEAQEQFENDVIKAIRDRLYTGNRDAQVAAQLIGPHITDDVARIVSEEEDDDEEELATFSEQAAERLVSGVSKRQPVSKWTSK